MTGTQAPGYSFFCPSQLGCGDDDDRHHVHSIGRAKRLGYRDTGTAYLGMRAWRPDATMGGCWRHAKARRIFQPLIQWALQGAGQSVCCLGGRWGGVASVRASAIEPCRRDGSAGNYMDREHSAKPEGNDAARYPCIPDGSKIGPWDGRSLTAHPIFWESCPAQRDGQSWGLVSRYRLGLWGFVLENARLQSAALSVYPSA